MSEITPEVLAAKQTELMGLLRPHLRTDIMQRANAYCYNKTGKKITEFLGQAVDPAEKAKIIDEMIEILKSKDYAKLPVAPTGQAAEPTKAAAPATPAPAPKPAAPVTPKPQPTAATAPVATPAPAPAAPANPADPIGTIMAALEQLKQPTPGGVTMSEVNKAIEQRVAHLVAVELAEVVDAKVNARLEQVFATMAKVLKGGE